ncbi:hypothetical protein BZA70DRAFT_278513 [Myxozyma melibiosi]|uniref:26S proteasome non-ATPase regulatory subunit 5 n=1 Tax=Myxozyma melibiosi TaxID=54550 RepID=A0ABR1F6X2_9ASCO
MADDPYAALAAFLAASSDAKIPSAQACQLYISALRLAGTPHPGALTAVWPGIARVLQFRSLPSETAAVLVDDVIDPIVASGSLSWTEVCAVAGSADVLIGTVAADTHDKIRQAAVGFLSCFDFATAAEDESEHVLAGLLALITREKLSEGVVARIEKAVDKFLTHPTSSSVRPLVIRQLSEIRLQFGSSAVVASRIQGLSLIILRHSSAGVDDVPENLICFAVASDDILAELVTIQFYESLLELFLPPSIFYSTKPAYLEIADIYTSSSAIGLERTAAARALGRLAQTRSEIFADIDASLHITKNLTLRDDSDRAILTLVPGDYLAEHNPALLRGYPITSASLVDITCNLMRSALARSLLSSSLTSQNLLRLPVPDLLRVCKELASASSGDGSSSSNSGAQILVSMPGVMDVVLSKSGKMGYELMRLRGDVVDALYEVSEELIGPYWAGRIREAKMSGTWGTNDSDVPAVEVMDSTS